MNSAQNDATLQVQCTVICKQKISKIKEATCITSVKNKNEKERNEGK